MVDPEASPEPAARVLYLGGTGRCGSTLIDRMLGQYPGIFAAGEVILLWEFALRREGRCGCGQTVHECEVWHEIFREAYGSLADVPLRDMVQGYHDIRTRFVPLAATPYTRKRWLANVRAYLDGLEALYAAIPKVTGARWIVDSSKDSVYCLFLDTLPSIEISMAHLVRDPRAAAFSWRRTKADDGYDDKRAMPTHGPFNTAPLWALLNEGCALFGRRHPDRYQMIRYEDFAAEPRHAMDQIAALIDEPLDDRIWTGDHEVHLEVTHSCWGNANRFEGRDVLIRLDDEWESKILPRDRRLVTAMTWAQLPRFGYPRRLA